MLLVVDAAGMCRLEIERAADRVSIQALQAQTQQQLAAMANQQQQRMAAVQQQAAAAAASSSAESAAVVSGAVGLAGELGERHAAVLKDLAGLAVEVSKYRYARHIHLVVAAHTQCQCG